MTRWCICETPVMDAAVDAGCRRCGYPVDFSPKPIELERRYHVPRSQVWEGSRGGQRGHVHLHTVDGFVFQRLKRNPGSALCGRKGWYEREPQTGEVEICPRCLSTAVRLDRAGLLAAPAPGTVEAVIVARVVAGTLRDAEKAIDGWLSVGGEEDDRLVSYTVTDRASLAQEGVPS